MVSSKCPKKRRNKQKVKKILHMLHASSNSYQRGATCHSFFFSDMKRNGKKKSWAGTWDCGSEEVGKGHLQNDRTPAKRLNSSYVTQNVKDHGAMRAQMGKKPL